MIIVPQSSSIKIPKRYKKNKHTKSELIDITFNVIFYIEFNDCYKCIKEDITECSVFSKNAPLTPLITFKEKYIPAEKYGINIPVKLDGEKYEKLKKELKGDKFNDYLYSIAQPEADYKIKRIIEEHSQDREPIITKYIDLMPIRNTKEYTYESYDAEY